ncbi:serine protease, partial [Acidobacteria bacterium AH-259-L09]|nr:serine protease [Acidobacteria bacterium AH-259-L09]
MNCSLKKRIASCGLSLSLLLTLTTVARADTQTKGEKADKDLPLIVGGEEAQPGAWPWQAALVQSEFVEFTAQFCGGSLIKPDLVLTAAHCLFQQGSGKRLSPSELEVVLGRHALSSSEGERIAVTAVIPHPNFNLLPNDSDVAVLRLATPSTQTPITLIGPGQEELVAPGLVATVTGWGLLEDGGDGSDTLQQVSVPIVSNDTCEEVAGGDITENMLCLGSEEAGKGSCQGDSGGPLVVPNAQGDGFVQVGIVSFGGQCGAPGVSGVFTRVSKFLDWIEDPFSDQIYFAQFGNGAGLQSDVVLVNVSSTLPAVGNIIFRDFTGNRLSDDIVSARGSAQISGSRFTLPSGGMITLSSSGLGDLISGSATVTSESRISAVIRFRISGVGITGVGSSERHRAVIAPARRQGDLSTGVAIRNTQDEAITVSLTLKDPSGQVVENGSTQRTIPGQGREALFIQEIFPGADTSDFEGTISVEAESGRIA